MMNTAAALALTLVALGQTQAPQLERRQFKNGNFSVVMPRAFPLSDKGGYAAMTDDSLYLADSIPMGPNLKEAYKTAERKGPDALKDLLDKVPYSLSDDVKVTKTDSGSFRGFPCSRRWLKASDGSKGVLNLLLIKDKVYVLMFVTTAGDLDLKEAQRMLESFRLEKEVKKDSPLAPKPSGLNSGFEEDKNIV